MQLLGLIIPQVSEIQLTKIVGGWVFGGGEREREGRAEINLIVFSAYACPNTEEF